MKPTGQQENFVALINEHQGILIKICNSYTKFKEDKMDLYQEILYQIWRSYNSFRGEAKFSTWIYRIALNTAITWVRQDQKFSANQALYNEVFNSDEPDEMLLKLYEGINQLNKTDRAFILLYLEDYSYKEISEIMGLSVSKQMNLDSYKEHWKNNSNPKPDELEKEKLLSMIHKKTKENVRNKTLGLMGITMGCIGMILSISQYQKSIASPLVNKICLFLVPAIALLAFVSARTFYLTNISNSKEQNTLKYLNNLIKNLRLLNKLFYFIILPLIPIVTMPLLLLIIDKGHVSQENIQNIFIIAGALMGSWWIIGYSVLFKKILYAHDYYQLQLKVETEFEQLN